MKKIISTLYLSLFSIVLLCAQNKGEFISLDSALAHPNDVLILDLRYMGISKLPPEIKNLKNLTTMYLAGNDMETLPPEIGELKNLREIHLQDNFLVSLPKEIALLPNLEILEIPYNKIENIPEEITTIKTLKQLNLRGNKLADSTQKKIEKAMPNCNISFNEKQILSATQPLLSTEELLHAKVFTNIDEAINNPPEVFLIRISNQNLEHFPAEILKLKNLQALDLSNNELIDISPNITQLTLLQQLNLRKNKLRTLPGELKELKNLKELKLGLNKFSTVPDVVWEINSLKYLDLSFNKSIFILPKGIGQLKNLDKLNLYSCSIQKISEEIGELEELKELDLFGNNLTELPPTIVNCKKLEIIILNSNVNLDYMTTAKLLAKCPNLKSVDFRNCGIPSFKRNKVKSYFPNVELIF